ncbi:hypothetical protein JCM18750_23860 [Halostagnicola bangensis]
MSVVLDGLDDSRRRLAEILGLEADVPKRALGSLIEVHASPYEQETFVNSVFERGAAESPSFRAPKPRPTGLKPQPHRRPSHTPNPRVSLRVRACGGNVFPSGR